MITPSAIRDEMLRQLETRGAGKSICPSEVARALSPDWHVLMKPVRAVAVSLVREERIDILSKGKPVDLPEPGPAPATAGDVKGVIRLRLRQRPG